MPSFDVRFIKTVCDDTGHEHQACQAAFTVEALSLTEAVRRAEADFCRQKQVHDWTIFADAVEFECRRRWSEPGLLSGIDILAMSFVRSAGCDMPRSYVLSGRG